MSNLCHETETDPSDEYESVDKREERMSMPPLHTVCIGCSIVVMKAVRASGGDLVCFPLPSRQT